MSNPLQKILVKTIIEYAIQGNEAFIMALCESAYFGTLKNKKVVVLGLGVSNRPLVRMLLHYGVSVIGCDKTPREKLSEGVLQLEKDGCQLRLGDAYLENLSADVVFRTPGIHPDIPQLRMLRESGALITSEMEAFFTICPCRIIAVTGSDGKTTTTTLIAELLRQAGKTVWLGGNIGQPLLPLASQMREEDFAVVELSSFQLMDMTHSAHVAVVTNVSPNHLDVHRDMEEYTEAKKNVFRFQKPEDKVVLNRDSRICCEMAKEAPGKAVFFSRQEACTEGLCYRDGIIFRSGAPILRKEDILIPGVHNVENYMAAILATQEYVSDADIRHVAAHFRGVEHRIELVREKDGVRYYNDSIASSPSRTVAGLRSFTQKVILIAGGYDKHIAYDELGPEIVRHVKLLILNGTTGPQIRRATVSAPNYAPGSPEILEADDFYQATAMACERAQAGDVVLLSPASASFDQFPNFAARGLAFRRLIEEL